jgi:hypothetical protein
VLSKLKHSAGLAHYTTPPLNLRLAALPSVKHSYISEVGSRLPCRALVAHPFNQVLHAVALPNSFLLLLQDLLDCVFSFVINQPRRQLVVII